MLFLLFSLVSLGAMSNEEDFFELSLEELLNVEVTSVSKDSESLTETAALISTYDKEYMERLGVSSLKELLSLIPGVIVNKGVSSEDM